MSDFYRRRRIVIKDASALLAFFIGFVWSGAFLWPLLANGVDAGHMLRGLAYFLAAVLSSAVVAGLLGLEAGNALGGAWEHFHRLGRRGRIPTAGHPAGTFPSAGMGPDPVAQASQPLIDPAGIYVARDGVYAASYHALATRVRADRLEIPRLRRALAKTVNIGAWDAGRLVGVVRVLDDGYTFTAVADLIVDPDYQGLGIGRRLMAEALNVSADNRLFVDAPPECAGFFERIGCNRGPTGFLMTHAAVIT